MGAREKLRHAAGGIDTRRARRRHALEDECALHCACFGKDRRRRDTKLSHLKLACIPEARRDDNTAVGLSFRHSLTVSSIGKI